MVLCFLTYNESRQKLVTNGEDMGMTDLQFKDFLRGLLDDLESAKSKKDKKETDEKLDRMIERFKKAVED